MGVNFTFKSVFNNRLAVGSGIAIVMLTIFFIASSFTKRSDRDVRTRQINLIIRQIGHRLLLQAGDSTSRVLPVTEIKEGTFRLTLEKEFVFSHDSLMLLSQGLLTKTQFPSGYTVAVYECMKPDIVYGFQVNNNSLDILPCRGRSQPQGCYIIEITFPDLHASSDYPLTNLVYSGMLVLLFVALIGRFGKVSIPVHNQDRSVIKEPLTELSALGKFYFDIKNQRLLQGTEVISLTDKECRILELLNQNFGELISRETLMQKIWINEGVITGRSLDMFVSKIINKLII
jgi:hypothetical protein